MDDYRDAVSSLTHLFTAGWAVFATLVLLRLTRGHGPGRWAVGLYGLTMILLYTASGTFHGLVYLAAPNTDTRPAVVQTLWVAQRLDKSAIFALIAGSYTPVFVYLLTGPRRRWCMGLMWGIAAAGSAMVWFWPTHPHSLLVGVYISMGLVGMLPMRRFFPQIGWRGTAWVAAFAGVYILGAAADVARWPTLVPGYFGPHEVLHVADMLGTWLHFGFVLKFLIFRTPPVRVGKQRSRRAVAVAS